MRISDWSSDVCSSDLVAFSDFARLSQSNTFTGANQNVSGTSARWTATDGGVTARLMAESSSSAVEVGDRKSVVSGKSVSVRVDLGGGRIIKKKKTSCTLLSNRYSTKTN